MCAYKPMEVSVWHDCMAYGDERDMTVCMKVMEVSVWHDCDCVCVCVCAWESLQAYVGECMA